MKTSLEQGIFKQGSRTYYVSAKFFPRDVREDVFKLYSFVRTADDYVDQVPAKAKEFKALRHEWEQAQANADFDTAPNPADSIAERVVKNIVYLTRKYDFEPEWVIAFMDSMYADLHPQPYAALDDTLAYIHGSAEVVGLMMHKIMGLPAEAAGAAMAQGRAMQWINFIRDIAEDNALGRCYFPQEDLNMFDLKDLSQETAAANLINFTDFINFQLTRYAGWQTEANEGFKYIPRRSRIPLQTAADTYHWTAQQIAKNPLIIFEGKVKPSKLRILLRAKLL